MKLIYLVTETRCRFSCSPTHSSTDPVVTASLTTPSNNSKCLKCGVMKKSGKRSCCTRGGAWYKSCGDVGDSSVDHTWFEGIQACKDFVSLTLTVQQRASMSSRYSMPNAGVTHSTKRFKLVGVTVYFCALSLVMSV